MGSEKILKKIKSGAFGRLIVGLCLLFLPLLVIVLIIAKELADDNLPFIIIGILCSIFGLILAVYNVILLADPKKSFIIHKNPDILLQADELYSNIIYQDRILVFSSRIIANAQNITQIAYTDEVFVIYVYIHKTNGIVDMKLLKLETARGTIQINIVRKKDEEINELINLILGQCRYARVGYNQDSMAYLKQMRDIWKMDQEKKHIIKP